MPGSPPPRPGSLSPAAFDGFAYSMAPPADRIAQSLLELTGADLRHDEGCVGCLFFIFFRSMAHPLLLPQEAPSFPGHN